MLVGAIGVPHHPDYPRRVEVDGASSDAAGAPPPHEAKTIEATIATGPTQRAEGGLRLIIHTAAMSLFSSDDPERQANIAFILIFLGIVFVGGLTIWLFYGTSF